MTMLDRHMKNGLTIDNLNLFAKQKRTKPIINALHGRDIDEAKRWYEGVKFFNSNGWAFAGDLASDLFLTLSLIVHMWKDGAFEGEKGQWLHFLGFGTTQAGCIFSHLHRVLRDVVNPNLQVTYDNANAFSESGRGTVYLYHSPEQLGAKPISIEKENFDDTLQYNDPEKPYPDAWSPVMREIPVGDIRTNNPKGDSNLDGLGYAILQAHNAFVHVKAITDAYYLMQHEMVRIVKYMQANQTPGSNEKISIPMNEIGWIADYCAEIIRVSTIIENVFSSDDPFDVLSEHEDRLRAFHSAR
jgi:hypothetical protein